jgi:hypothetical protein
MEELFETAVALAEDGRTTRKGMPKPLDLALFVSEFEQEVQGAFPPVAIQRIALGPLAWLGRRRGLGARYAPRTAYASEADVRVLAEEPAGRRALRKRSSPTGRRRSAPSTGSSRPRKGRAGED